jgi:hypothetical protein
MVPALDGVRSDLGRLCHLWVLEWVLQLAVLEVGCVRIFKGAGTPSIQGGA